VATVNEVRANGDDVSLCLEACCICLNDLKTDSENGLDLTTTTCNHTFHEACINQWKRECRKHSPFVFTCPMCRDPTPLGKLNHSQERVHVQTALHVAAMMGHSEIVQLLCDHGANVNLQDGHMRTALHWASLRGHTNTVKILMDNNADFGILDSDGLLASQYLIAY